MHLASVVAGGERWAAVVKGDRAFVTEVPGLDAALAAINRPHERARRMAPA